ncbi:MAG TPA: LacI family DNA-binding transcriptional regulator [Victivallales bacterium]|nr:LacI family DNA-binding transcriptional regulator [Victivallales bacterium]
MTTIKDIAKELGISAQAVSRALNHKSNISDTLKEKVTAKAKEIGYIKNRVASSLKTKETKLIGIFMFKRTFEIRQKVLEGIFSEARKNRYDILFFTMDCELDNELSYSDLCAQRMVEGAIFIGIRMDDPHIGELRTMNIPVVLLDSFIGGNSNTVSMDHEKAIKQAIQYSKIKGYEKIGLITGHTQAQISNKVVGYYKNEIKNLNDQFIEYSDYTEDSGYLSAKKMLDNQLIPECIIAINNSVAMGILKFVEESGKKTPEDVAIIQLNDIHASELVKPSLTSFYQNDLERGIISVQLILKKAAGKHILVDPVLNIRNSA